MKKVKSGDSLSIPAATFNNFIDVAEDFKRRTMGLGGSNVSGVSQSQTICIENLSGSDIAECEVLGISGSGFTPSTNLLHFQQNLLLSCETPTADHKGKFVVTAEPIAAGKIGRAYAYGICVAKVNIADDAHDYADINDSGVFESSENGSGAILWKNGTSGVQTCIIRIANNSAASNSFWAKLTGGGGPWSLIYNFIEQDYSGGHSFADKPNGRTGYAYEVNDVRGLYNPDEDRYVRIYDNGGYYSFNAPLIPTLKTETGHLETATQQLLYKDEILQWARLEDVSVLDDYTVDASTLQFKKKYRTIHVLADDAQTTYTRDHQGTDCLGELV